jgi:hypothetical protein
MTQQTQQALSGQNGFAGCPGCNLHLRSIAKRHDEILGADLRDQEIATSGIGFKVVFALQ